MLTGFGYSAAKVAWLSGGFSAIATLVQSVAQGTATNSVVLPTAVGVGVVSGLLGYIVQQARMKEWQRIHERIAETNKAETTETIASVRSEMWQSGLRLEQKITDVAKDQREDFQTLTRTMGEVKDALMQTVIRRRGQDA